MVVREAEQTVQSEVTIGIEWEISEQIEKKKFILGTPSHVAASAYSSSESPRTNVYAHSHFLRGHLK